MSRSVSGPVPRAASGVPSVDGLRLLLAGVGWLFVICTLQAATIVLAISAGSVALPVAVWDVRDVVALFGWVGLMISGVSVILVPNHLRERIGPSYLPRVHFWVANVGLVGFFVSSLAVAPSPVPEGFLLAVSVSFGAFGWGVLRTVFPAYLRLSQADSLTPLTGAPT